MSGWTLVEQGLPGHTCRPFPSALVFRKNDVIECYTCKCRARLTITDTGKKWVLDAAEG